MRWEYKTLQTDLAGSRTVIRLDDGAELREWKRGADLHAALTAYGAHGWEMCGVWHVQSFVAIILLKRPAP